MKLLLAMVAALAVTIQGVSSQGVFRPCPQYWHLFQGSCYRYYGDRVTWQDALNRCRDHYTRQGRGDLASIHNAEENGFLYDLFRSSAGDTPSERPPYYGAWIGLYQENAGSTGPFIWSDGTSYDDDESPWLSGQPDNHQNNEDCGHIWRRNAADDILQGWNDIRCDVDLPFICKMAP